MTSLGVAFGFGPVLLVEAGTDDGLIWLRWAREMRFADLRVIWSATSGNAESEADDRRNIEEWTFRSGVADMLLRGCTSISAYRSDPRMNTSRFTPRYFPFPQPTSRPIDPGGKARMKASTTGHGCHVS